ncbi:MAG: tetratricopeptide repeat protein [Calditrichaeota bacterium]|nr:MAG: tetratricopeptide repeat protein [Calditrichota bacterium]
MEYIDGEELTNLAKVENLRKVEDYAKQIASGLQAAHEKGIVHRDIKSGNIMITKTGQVKIMDFGLAKAIDDKYSAFDDSTVGTASYMSPEQAQGDEVDQRSDLWAFGVVLYEMLSGEMPFRGDYEQALIYSIINEEPEPLSDIDADIPPQLQSVIDKCLKKSREERYTSAAEIMQDLQVEPEQKPVENEKGDSEKALLPKIVIGFAVALLLLLVWTNFGTLKNWVGMSVLPEEKHIAVLPFTNVQGDESSQAFCDGLIEVLTSKITQFEQFQQSLLVIPASEIRQLEVRSASAARKQFNANLAISGSVERTQKRLQLTMNLIDAEKLTQLNSIVITDDYEGASDFQDRVVTHLAGMLQLNLLPETQRLLVAGHTSNPGAYDYYIRGYGYLRDHDRLENIEKAIELFQQSLKEDSLYALAWSGLGEAYWYKYDETKEAKWIDVAQEKCQRALALDNLLAPVHVTLGILAKGTGKYEQAVQDFKRALEIDPVNSDALRELAGAYVRLNQPEKVEELYLEAIDLKPGHWENYYELALFYYRKGDYAKAEKQYQIVAELSPQNYKAVRNLGVIYLLKEQYEKAQIMCERSIAIKPNYGAYANLGLIYFTQNKYKESARMYEKALELNDNFYLNWGNLAISYDLIPEEKHKAKPTYLHAIELAEKQLAVNPNNIKCLRSLASYYSALGQFDKSIHYLVKALGLAPDDVELMFQAAGRYLEVNNREQALYFVERALQNGYSPHKIKQSDSMKSLSSDKDFIALLEKYSRNK